MTNYQPGQCLELNVVNRGSNSIGSNYITVTDGELEYRIFNLLKCQLIGDLPSKLYLVVSSIDAFGKVKLKQDLKRVLKEHYANEQFGTFNITDRRDDTNGRPYYLIEDDFAEHRFYYSGEQKHQIGDSLVLDLNGVDERGYLQMAEHAQYIPATPQPTPTSVDSTIRSTNTANYGPESTTVEYKSSIVFDPKTSMPDIVTQTSNIVIELAAMMNTEGGKLIIGVRDSDQVVTGIEEDYRHINDDDNDTFTYKTDKDGFEQKLRHVLNYLCPTLAGSLVEFHFKTKNNHEYCVIDIQRADRPIWVRCQAGQGSILYIRQGNRRKTIYGEELTNFIFRRMKGSVDMMAGGAQAVAQLDEDKLEEILRRIINEKKQVDIQVPSVPTREIDHWVVWQADGIWQRQRDKAEKCFMQVPCYKNMSNPILVFAYPSGMVSAMKWVKIKSGVNLKTPQKNIWYQNEVPNYIFLAEVNDLLIIHSIDYNHTEHIKLHALTDFSATDGGKAKGIAIVPANNSICQIAMIDASYLYAVKGLVRSKTERSTEVGEPTNTASHEISKQIAFVQEVLKQAVANE